MIQLVIGILLMCSSLGVTLSKITVEHGVKKTRQHNRPLTIEKDVLA